MCIKYLWLACDEIIDINYCFSFFVVGPHQVDLLGDLMAQVAEVWIAVTINLFFSGPSCLCSLGVELVVSHL